MANKNYSPRILVLTLNSGENEYAESLSRLKSQSYRNWEYIEFNHLPNKEAHERLYDYIMNHSEDYDLFVKMDADMMLRDERALQDIVEYFAKNTNVHQANFSVWDVISQQSVMGLIVFRNTARWEKTKEMLFVDQTPTIPGKRLLVWGFPSPVAYHSHNPHNFQAFHFGAHRAMKAIQKEREKVNLIQSVIQWNFLWKVWKNYKRERSLQRAYFLIGAYYVWTGKLVASSNDYADETLRVVFDNTKHLSEVEIYGIVKDNFASQLRRKNWLYILFWPKLYMYKLKCRLEVFCNSVLMSLKNSSA